jgi:hypothetical protein
MLESAELPSKRFSRIIVRVPSHLKFKTAVNTFHILSELLKVQSFKMTDKM